MCGQDEGRHGGGHQAATCEAYHWPSSAACDAGLRRHWGAPGGRTDEGLRDGGVFGKEAMPLMSQALHPKTRTVQYTRNGILVALSTRRPVQVGMNHDEPAAVQFDIKTFKDCLSGR